MLVCQFRAKISQLSHRRPVIGCGSDCTALH